MVLNLFKYTKSLIYPSYHTYVQETVSNFETHTYAPTNTHDEIYQRFFVQTIVKYSQWTNTYRPLICFTSFGF